MKKLNVFFTLIILSIFIFSSCQENKIIETGTENSKDYLFAENLFNDVGRIVEDAFIDNGTVKSCPNYTLINADSTNMDTIIIDFGDGNPDDCLSYGKERRGKIIITFTGKYKDSLSVIRTTFDRYYVNDNWIQGERILTNNGRNSEGNITFSIEVIGANIRGNGTINWESSRTREWIAGYNTFSNPFDDRYIVSGSARGNSRSGQEFNVNITENLIVDLSCLNSNSCIITSGEAELVPDGFSTRMINYGDSICDCNYSVSLNGTEYFVVIN
tara:strand:+ start:37 stop:852 length:816 start_codon:yes stop_codon:yes gene_type:complete